MRPSVTVPVLSVQMTSAAPTISTMGERAHERLSLQHLTRAEREGQREDDRQALRHCRYREGDSSDERFEYAQVAGQQLQRSDDADQHGNGPPYLCREASDLALEDGWFVFGLLHLRARSRRPRFACRCGPPASALARRMTTVPLDAIQNRSASAASSETGWVFLRTGRLSPVSADSSTLRSMLLMTRPSAGMREPSSSSTTSPGDQRLGVHLLRYAVTKHRCGRGGEAVQRFDATARAVVLRETEARVQHHDERYEPGVYQVVGLVRDECDAHQHRSRGDEHEYKRAAELVQQQFERGDGGSAGQLVRAVSRETRRCLAGGQSGSGRSEAFKGILHRRTVPGCLECVLYAGLPCWEITPSGLRQSYSGVLAEMAGCPSLIDEQPPGPTRNCQVEHSRWGERAYRSRTAGKQSMKP